MTTRCCPRLPSRTLTPPQSVQAEFGQIPLVLPSSHTQLVCRTCAYAGPGEALAGGQEQAGCPGHSGGMKRGGFVREKRQKALSINQATGIARDQELGRARMELPVLAGWFAVFCAAWLLGCATRMLCYTGE